MCIIAYRQEENLVDIRQQQTFDFFFSLRAAPTLEGQDIDVPDHFCFASCVPLMHAQLESASNYRILSASGCTVLEGVDDADRFKAIQDALTTVGVDDNAQKQVR